MAKATINLQLTYDEATVLSKFLPQVECMTYEETVVADIKQEICRILNVKSWDLN